MAGFVLSALREIQIEVTVVLEVVFAQRSLA
jgi:hypothetical protein